MKEMMKKLRYAAALVAGMFTLGAQAETYYLQPGPKGVGDDASTSSMSGLGSNYGGWATEKNASNPDRTSDAAKKALSGNTYIIPLGLQLRTPTSGAYTFLGDELVFEGGSINVKHSNGQALKIPTLTVRAPYTEAFINNGNNSTYYLTGTEWNIEEGSMLTFNVSGDTGSRTFYLGPKSGTTDMQKFTGAGTLKLFTDYGGTIANAYSDFHLHANFASFQGGILIDGCQKTRVFVDSGAVLFNSDGGGMTSITINDVRKKLTKGGGSTLNPRSGNKDDAVLTFNENVTAGSGCRWTLTSKLTSETEQEPVTEIGFSIASGKTVDIKGPITSELNLKKLNSGTLKFTHPNLEHYSGTKSFGNGTFTITANELKFMADFIEHWASLAAVEPSWDGTTLTLTLTRGLTFESNIKVAYSNSEDGDSIDWDSVEKHDILDAQENIVKFGSGVTRLPVNVTPPTGTTFVRFYNDSSEVVSNDRWSNVLDMSKYEVDDSPTVKLAELKAMQTGIVDAELSINLTGLGYGATAAELTAFYTHDGLAEKEKVIATGRATTGEITFTLENLKPNTTYQVYVTAKNELEDSDARFPAEGAEPFTIKTMPEAIGDMRLVVDGKGNWTPGVSWDQATSTAGNLILGKMPTHYENALLTAKTDSGAAATDGKFPKSSTTEARYFGVGDACIVEWELDSPSTITAVRLYTSGEDNLGKISVQTVFATEAGVEKQISSTYYSSDGAGENFAYLLPPPGQALVNDATAVRIRFTDGANSEAHTPYNAYYSEIEVIGFDSGYSKSIEVTNSSWDGSTLMASLSRDAGGAASEIFAYYGTAYGGDVKEDWQSRVKVGEFVANVAQTAVVLPNVPEGTRYVRFVSDKDGWSESFLMPDLAQSESTALLADVLTTRDVRETSVGFSGYCTALGEGATKVDIVAEYKSGEETEYGHRTVLWSAGATGFEPSATLDLVLHGLEPETAYSVRVRVENDAGAFTEWREFAATTLARGLIEAAVTGVSTIKNLETMEQVLVFNNTAQSATLTVTKAGYAEVLLVGGGGGGGTGGNAAGGGAGGYLHYDNIFFPIGAYTITVGAGGARGENNHSGYKGGDTTISYSGDGEFQTVTAYGGGGGDIRSSGTLPATGVYGSTGGAGGTRNAQTHSDYLNKYQPTTGQGNYGGDGVSDFGGGGGGANSKGSAAVKDANQNVWTGGAGGNGLACAITDEIVYYAGGGGGCANYGGAGGLGGGGRGYGSTGQELGASGVDGTGGGGGGGTVATVKGVQNTITSGNGGSGTVIFRFTPESDALKTTPAVQLRSVTPVLKDGLPSVEMNYRVCSEGDGNVVIVDFEYGADEEAPDHTVRLQSNAALGDYVGSVTGLRSETIYFGRVKVTDEQGNTKHSRALQFTTPAGTDTGVDTDAPSFTDFAYSTENPAHKVEITARGSQMVVDGKETTAKLYVGYDETSLVKKNITFESAEEGEVKVFCDEIDFDTTYYAEILVNNGVGATRSRPFTFSVPGQSVLEGCEVTSEQNVFKFKVTVGTVGAGETVVRLLASTVSADALAVLTEWPVTASGVHDFEYAFPWDTTVYYRIDVANSFGGQSWRSPGTPGSKSVSSDDDTADYTWKTEKNGGLWHNADNWAVAVSAVGYPLRNATAKFPSGTDVANMVESEVKVDRDQAVGCLDWGFSYGTVTLTGVGDTLPSVTMPDAGHTFDFSAGTYANVILDHIKASGTGGDNHVVFGDNNTLTLKNGAQMTGFGAGSAWRIAGAASVLRIEDTAKVAIPSGGLTLDGTNARIELADGGTLEQGQDGGAIELSGDGAAIVVTGGTLDVAGEVKFTGGTAKIVLAGASPSVTGTGDLYASVGQTGRVEFAVPVDGFANVPVRLGDFNVETGRGKIVLAVPADAPAATAETDVDVVLVSATSINPDNFTLADLPHPDTDRWIWTKADGTEAGEGDAVTGLEVHLVGRPSTPTKPVVRGLHVKSSTAATDDETADATVTFEADFRRGGSSTSATWSYKLDDAAEWTAIDGTFNQAENVKELTVSGFAKGSKHTLHLQGVSSDGVTGDVIDYAFGTIGAIAELGAASGVTAESWGPYTRFVAGATSKGTFEVLVAQDKATIAFGDAEATVFTLNSGTYTIDGLTLANEGGVLYSAPANAESMTVTVLTREVKNEPSFGVDGLAVAANGAITVTLNVMDIGGTLTNPETPPESFAAKFVWGYLPDHLVYEVSLGEVSASGSFSPTESFALPASTLVYWQVIGDNREENGVLKSDIRAYLPNAGSGANAPQVDKEAPYVSNLALDASAGVALDAVFTAANAASYAFRTAATEDMSGAVLMTAEATAGENGKTTLTLAERVPGEAFYVQVVAYAAEGKKCFATYPRLVTMPTAATFTKGPTVTVENQNTLKVTGTVQPGAGETWVIGEFTVGDGEPQTIELAHWVNGVDKPPYNLNWSQAFENAWDKTIAYTITLKNEVPDTEYSWTAAPVGGTKDIADIANYTWTGASESEGPKLWNDPANWSSDRTTGVGYPTANSTPKFTAAGAPDVALDADHTVKAISVSAGARVVFSGKHTVTIASAPTLNVQNVTFGAKDEATVRVEGNFHPNASGFTTVLDNATLYVNSFLVYNSSFTLQFSGAKPCLQTRSYFAVRSDNPKAKIVLTVPKDGWTSPVILCDGMTAAKKFGETDNLKTSFAFEVDPASPALEYGVEQTMTIVNCADHFSANNLALGTDGKPAVTCASTRNVECSLALNAADPATATMLNLTLRGAMAAQIGDVKYATLAEAIAAVTDWATITLIDDLTLREQVKTEGKSFTLDLGKKTVTFDGCDGFYFVGGNVTVRNGTVVMAAPATDNKFAAIGFEDAVGLVKDVVVNAGNAKDGVVCCSAGDEFNGKTVTCENVDVTGAGRNFYAETAAMTLDADCSAAQSGQYAGGAVLSDALAAGWLGQLTVNGGTYSGEVAVVGTMSSPATITLNAGTFTGNVSVVPVAPGYAEMGEHNITKDEAVELAAPEGYKWDAKGKLVVKVPVAEYKGEQYYSVEEAMEAALADAKEQGKDIPDPITIIADGEEEISGEVKDFDSSKEVVFVKDENEQVVPVVQTSTAIMQAVTVTASAGSDPVALTANTQKLREFLAVNKVEAYTTDHTSAAAISEALAAVPTVEGNNGLPLWKDYALGITPTDSVKAVADAAHDTDKTAITLVIPALKDKEGSGDFTIKYQVVDRAGKEETRTAERADAIKIPLATGIYDVKIVFEPKEN